MLGMKMVQGSITALSNYKNLSKEGEESFSLPETLGLRTGLDDVV